MLTQCGEVIPSEKTHLIKRISKIVDISPSEEKMVLGLRAETVAEIEAMEQEFSASEREFKQQIKKAVQEVKKARVEAEVCDRQFT